MKYCDFTHYTLVFYINVFKIYIIYTAPTCDGDLFFQNGDPILSEMGTFSGRNGDPKAHFRQINQNKLASWKRGKLAFQPNTCKYLNIYLEAVF